MTLKQKEKVSAILREMRRLAVERDRAVAAVEPSSEDDYEQKHLIRRRYDARLADLRVKLHKIKGIKR